VPRNLSEFSALYFVSIQRTGHNHISIPFAELILAALNGHTIDWVEEFRQELRDEIVKLHQKHSQNTVKVM